MTDVFLLGVGSFVPDNMYTNVELCEVLKLPLEKAARYEALLGIVTRPICVDYRAGGRQVVSGEELAFQAARAALSKASLDVSAVDTVITCSSFFDYLAPSISSRLLKRLGMSHALTFDLIGGCAEFLHGLSVGANLIRLEQARNVLVTSSEVINAWWAQTRYPIEHFIFGDTGGAVVLSSSEGPYRLRQAYLNTRANIGDEPAELICVPIIGGKEPVPLFYDNREIDPRMAKWSDIPTPLRLVHNMRQVAIGAPQAMVEATARVLAEANGDVIPRTKVRPEDVFLVPHQASIGVLSGLTATGVPESQIAVSLRARGNMSTSSVPVTLSEHWEEALRQPYLVMTSVGVGMSYGALLFEQLSG